MVRRRHARTIAVQRLAGDSPRRWHDSHTRRRQRQRSTASASRSRGHIPLEMGLRIKGILKAMAGGKMSAADYRGLSAVEILYHSGSPAGRQLLQTISQGDRGSHQTRAASAALAWLK